MNNIRNFLPSGHFVSITSSLAVAALLIWAATHYTSPTDTPRGTLEASNAAFVEKDWQQTLFAIQEDNASSRLPDGPTQEVIAQVLEQAKTNNLTDTLSRSLAINLIAAKEQGLGDDIVSQERIVAQTLAQAQPERKTVYTKADLVITSDATSSVYAYGNAFMKAVLAHPEANMQQVYVLLAEATDTKNPASIKKLRPIKDGYRAMLNDLLKVPVPASMVPFQLVVLNDFAAVVETFPAMESIFTDPLRGLVAAREFDALMSEEGRMFIQIAGALQKAKYTF